MAKAGIGAAFPKPIGCNLGVVAPRLLARAPLLLRPIAVGFVDGRPDNTGPAAMLDPAAMCFNREGRTVLAQAPALVSDPFHVAFNATTNVFRYEGAVVRIDQVPRAKPVDQVLDRIPEHPRH